MDEKHSADALSTLSSLVGTWHGNGTARFPSMEAVDFAEEIRFSRRSPNSFDYWQRAVPAGDGSMLHSESGIWRATSAGALEITVALPGATEVSEGTVDGATIRVESTAIGLAATGAKLRQAIRRYDLTGDSLAYDISIATAEFELTAHISGELHRSESRSG
jgi:hypothetical protein